MYFRKKTTGGRAYLQIVEPARRRSGAPAGDRHPWAHRRVLASRRSNACCALAHASLPRRWCLVRWRNDAATRIAVRRVGPTLVFERLRAETGCQSVITALDTGRNHRFALERAVFLRVPHRLMGRGRIWRQERPAREHRMRSPVARRCARAGGTARGSDPRHWAWNMEGDQSGGLPERSILPGARLPDRPHRCGRRLVIGCREAVEVVGMERPPDPPASIPVRLQPMELIVDRADN